MLVGRKEHSSLFNWNHLVDEKWKGIPHSTAFSGILLMNLIGKAFYKVHISSPAKNEPFDFQVSQNLTQWFVFSFSYNKKYLSQFLLAWFAKYIQNTKIPIILTISIMVQTFMVFGLDCWNTFLCGLPALSCSVSLPYNTPISTWGLIP